VSTKQEKRLHFHNIVAH